MSKVKVKFNLDVKVKVKINIPVIVNIKVNLYFPGCGGWVVITRFEAASV